MNQNKKSKLLNSKDKYVLPSDQTVSRRRREFALNLKIEQLTTGSECLRMPEQAALELEDYA